MIFLPLLSCPLPLEALLAALNSLPPLSLSLHANSLPDRSPLRNRVWIRLHSFSEMFSNSPSDAGRILKAYSLACKALQNLVLMYLSYFLPGNLLSYH